MGITTGDTCPCADDSAEELDIFFLKFISYSLTVYSGKFVGWTFDIKTKGHKWREGKRKREHRRDRGEMRILTAFFVSDLFSISASL
jgi:hypothetical protein